ncbi:TonB-dependent receptor plug domain-containing protein [Hyphococcus sp.]|uniref:TonB-dependent receptor plug domain-containing protein n=1 Tax=Hyphococcus sp. TaxID=2038636 RepID=UPI00208019BD|nr:MAG: TonB-dependent receptor [Marinicaulis sp.]
MKTKSEKLRGILGSTALCTATVFVMQSAANVSYAQEDGVDDSDKIVVTGTRRANRTVGNSMIPIDVIDGDALEKSGTADLTDILRTQVVSLNVQRFVTNDGNVFQRPFTLRGLAPDQTLLLINGKRRHRSALIATSRLPQTLGAQGPDLATIPSNAISQLEVLRDGASAQYGSDAIAGVLNVGLSEDSDVFRLATQYGQFYAGDGGEFKVQGNIGLPLTDSGFFHAALEYVNSESTSRGAQRPDVAALVAAGTINIADVPENGLGQRWGNPDGSAFRSFFNAGIDLDNNLEAYLFGNYSRSKGVTSFFYRNPTNNVNLVANLPLTMMPGGPRFSFTSIFPGGFSPQFEATTTDWSVAGGVRGELTADLSFDASVYHGENKADYHISQSINPSLGPASPTEFDPGTLTQRETTVNFDLVYLLNVDAFASPVNVAGGAEFHREDYLITLGDEASYIVGPFASYIDPDTMMPGGVQVGSNGFQGFNPSEVGDFGRYNYALYLDLEADLTQRISGGVAIRFEDFNDFGTTFNYKVSGRAELFDGVAIRGSVNTGFRAPTPGQANLSQTSTNIDLATGATVVSGQIPQSNPVAVFFGAEPLRVEESFNFAGGLVLDLPGGVHVTADYFNIKLDDRISVSGDIPIGPAEQAALITSGITGGGSLSSIRFFTNAFDTRTQGVDVVATYRTALGGDSSLNLLGSFNYTDTEVTQVRNPTAIDRERTLELEDFTPHYRALAEATFRTGPFSALVRGNYYGAWTDYGSSAADDQTFGGEWLMDIELGYYVNDNVRLAVGGENIFDNFPDLDTRAGNIGSGLIYPRFAPTGFNGGFWYARAVAEF